MKRHSAFLLIVMLCGGVISAQQPSVGNSSSSSETFDAEVRIESEHGQPVNIPLRVQLINQMSVSIMQGYSRDGRAEFRKVETGISGASEIEVTSGLAAGDEIITGSFKAIRTAVDTFGRLDVLHNNAGGSTAQDNTAVEAPLDEFWRAIKLDLFGTFLGCRFGIPELVKAGGG